MYALITFEFTPLPWPDPPPAELQRAQRLAPQQAAAMKRVGTKPQLSALASLSLVPSFGCAFAARALASAVRGLEAGLGLAPRQMAVTKRASMMPRLLKTVA